MSSATQSNPQAARDDVMSIGRSATKTSRAPGGLGMSRRQAELNRMWSFYRCQNYESRRVDWNGNPVMDHLETEAVSQAQFIPPGFYDVGQQYPLKFRRPSAPYYLGRVIVNRFTGFIFSQRRHPDIVCHDDPATEAWLKQVAEDTDLWSQMIAARNFGGAMGTVALGFKFVNGKPRIEVFDPRWCTPEFTDPEENDLRALEVRYQYPLEVRNEDGEMEERWFWYRREIDEREDIVWPKVPVGDGAEPVWDNYAHKRYAHAFGFCPVVWIQNIPVKNDPNGDGDSDCHGVYDTIETIDTLISQAVRGTSSNCDPTLVMSSDAEWAGGIKKGSANAMQFEKGGSAQYLEIQGTGPKAARELAEDLKSNVLEMTRCVLDEIVEKSGTTATEVMKRYGSMLEQADMLREQYGNGVKHLLAMMLKAVRQMSAVKVETGPDGLPRIVSLSVVLTPHIVLDERTGSRQKVQLDIGQGEVVDLRWPDYFDPSLDDVQKAVAAATQARDGGVVDAETAVHFVAKQFQIEDVKATIAKIKQEAEEAQQQSQATMMGSMGGF